MPENHDTDFNWPDFVAKINSELNGTYGNYVNRVMSLGNKLGGDNPLHIHDDLNQCSEQMERLEQIYVQVTQSLNRHRYKEALRHVMSAAQYGNQMLQKAVPWQYLAEPGPSDSSEYSDERGQSLSKLAFGWRLARFLAITSHPFLPFSAQRLWTMIGQNGNVSDVLFESATDWSTPISWSNISQPLFERLDLEAILEHEQSLALSAQDTVHVDPGHGVKGSGKQSKTEEEEEMGKAPEGTAFLDFETFMSVELRTGTISSVEDHPNADKLYLIHIDDGTDDGRTLCAALKPYYSVEEMLDKQIIFVANLEPRKLRGVLSEGMICAADDGEGNVKLITVDGSISNGSRVR